MQQISKEDAAKLFGIILASPLSEEQCEQIQKVEALLVVLAERTGVKDCELFDRTYPDQTEADRRLVHFLHHVSECPTEVIAVAELLIEKKREEEARKLAETPAE